MRNFLFLISFIVMLGQVAIGLAEQPSQATPEEEAAAKAAFNRIETDLEPMFRQKAEDYRKGVKSTVDFNPIIQRCLQLRDQYPHTQLTATRVSLRAGRLYFFEQENYAKALECFQWVVNRYSDIPDSILVDNNRSPYESYYWETGHYKYALSELPRLYYLTGHLEEAKDIYERIRDRQISVMAISVEPMPEEDALIIKKCPDYDLLRRINHPLRVVSEIYRKPGYYRLGAGSPEDTAKLMVCLLEQKLSKKEGK